MQEHKRKTNKMIKNHIEKERRNVINFIKSMI